MGMANVDDQQDMGGLSAAAPSQAEQLQGWKKEDLRKFHPDQLKSKFVEFFMQDEELVQKILDMVQADNERGKHFSLIVEIQDLIEFDTVLAHLLLHFPESLLPIFDDALIEAQQKMMPFVVQQQGAEAKGPSKKRKRFDMKLQSSTKEGEEFGVPKERCHVRVVGLPRTSPELRKPNISSLRSSDANGPLLQIHGTVIRAGPVKMLQVSQAFRCGSKRCGHTFRLYADLEQGNLLVPPQVCPLAAGAEGKKGCASATFHPVKGSEEFADYQEVKVQEEVHRLEVGSIPRTAVCVLRHDLVDRGKAGDDVQVVGVLMRRWRPLVRGVRCEVDQVLRANSLRVSNRADGRHQVPEDLAAEFEAFWKQARRSGRLLAARDQIVASVCPQVYGVRAVKLAVLLCLAGGVEECDARGLRRRGTPHLLLVGDPGTGKSQFLRFAAKLSPRAVMTTGVGTTSAGLTCTASKDGADWALEAGALVLADRGLCCIDEFSSIKQTDRTTIHEAMEQQTLSVAKAGLVCKLNTRTTVFAVTNPKGQYDTTADLTVNTAIDAPLLSRFDLVLVLLDTKEELWDEVVSTFILRGAMTDDSGEHTNNRKKARQEAEAEKHPERSETTDPARVVGNEETPRAKQARRPGGESPGGDERGGASCSASARGSEGAAAAAAAAGGAAAAAAGGAAAAAGAAAAGEAGDGGGGGGEFWSLDRLQKYLIYVKDAYRPRVGPEAERVLLAYYQAQRARGDGRSAARTTVRLLESLVRLAQAHARLMCRGEVALQDAVAAVLASEGSAHAGGGGGGGPLGPELGGGPSGALHSEFPQDPDREYRELEELVLRRLGLQPPAAGCPPPPWGGEEEGGAGGGRGGRDGGGGGDGTQHQRCGRGVAEVKSHNGSWEDGSREEGNSGGDGGSSAWRRQQQGTDTNSYFQHHYDSGHRAIISTGRHHHDYHQSNSSSQQTAWP